MRDALSRARVPVVAATLIALLAGAAGPGSQTLAADPPQPKGLQGPGDLTPLRGDEDGSPGTQPARVETQATSTSPTPVKAASAGDSATCAIRMDGTIGCWGYFVDWETDDWERATAPTGTFDALSVGSSFACAIRDDGTIACWGLGTFGQLDAPDGVFVDVATGDRHACARRQVGTLACWGANDFFQATLPAPDATFLDVDAGDGFTCGVLADGTLDCWGANGSNQSTPPPAIAAGPLISVSAGTSHACAIRADNSIACWGYNGSNRAIPPSGSFSAVSAGGAHTCALRDTALLDCWGSNDAGQAAEPPGAHASVSAGGGHSCALLDDGRLECWGDNYLDQVIPVPTAIVEDLPIWTTDTTIDVAWAGTAALAPVASYDVRRTAQAWNSTTVTTTTWQSATADTSATMTGTPGTTYCFAVRARDTDNLVSAWSEGRCTVLPLDDRSLSRSGSWTLGNDAGDYQGTRATSSAAGATLTRSGLRSVWLALVATTCPECGSVQVYWSGSSTPFRTVSLASPVTAQRRLIPLIEDYGDVSRTVVIKVATSGKPVIIDGLLASMNSDRPDWVRWNGNPPLPALASSGQAVASITGSYDGSCAVRTDGVLACWGNNDDGKAIPPAGTYLAVAQGDYHTCAIKTGGTLACWGAGVDEGLKPPDGGPYTSLASGGANSCAIHDGGRVDCWGWDVLYEDWSAPDGTFTAIASDGWNFCGLRTGGTLACWGGAYAWEDWTWPDGTFKAVGGRCAVRADDTVACWGRGTLGQDTPPAGTFKAVATGGLHSCGIRSDDTLACWGDNSYFEATPPVGTFKEIVAGAYHSCAIATDNTFACWGDDSAGQVTPRPRASINGPGNWLTTPTISVSWGATGIAPIATYDVRYRKAAWNGSFGSYVNLRTATTATSASLTGSPGGTYCFASRATDADGRVAAWTPETCSGVPLDDRSLSATGAWTRGSNAQDYKSTFSRASAKGATLTRTGVRTKKISILATTCPTCGKVGVYWGSTLLKTIDLASATTVHKKLFAVVTFSSVKSGTLKLKVLTSGKKVIIDGVGLRRS